jgi:3-deoxy-7-phosphoheptulonate synthase
MDFGAVPMLKITSHLPVIVDSSHGTGHWRMAPPLSKAAIAAGAEGLLVEEHCDSQKVPSDGPHTLCPDRFDQIMREPRPIAPAVGADLPLPERSQADQSRWRRWSPRKSEPCSIV